jgi:hypothetical protein
MVPVRSVRVPAGPVPRVPIATARCDIAGKVRSIPRGNSWSRLGPDEAKCIEPILHRRLVSAPR